MKPLAFCLLLFVAPSVWAAFPPAQNPIASCENRWFLKETKDPDTRALGFAYIDPTAGFTFEYDGDVAIDRDGGLERKSNGLGNARMIVRVASNFAVACLDDGQVAKLGLQPAPDWLKFYKDTRDAGTHAVMWGSHLNAIGAYADALRQLETARASGFKSDRLWFELGYAYNATGQFDKAAEVLEPAVAATPDDKQTIGELAFTRLQQHDFNRAIELYSRALSKFKQGETERKVEFAFNLSRAYQATGDEKSAMEWLDKAKAWNAQDQKH